MLQLHTRIEDCTCHCHNNHEGNDGTHGKPNCKCLPICIHCRKLGFQVRNSDAKAELEVNPITQRCKTISGEHLFQPMWKELPAGNLKISVEKNNQQVYECQICGLV